MRNRQGFVVVSGPPTPCSICRIAFTPDVVMGGSRRTGWATCPRCRKAKKREKQMKKKEEKEG